jgi:hemoglobin-like flavoprotein
MALDVQLLRSSFNLALARQPDLTHVFYDQLFYRYPAARPLFVRADMAVQEQMLGEALVAVLDHLENVPWLQSTLVELGAKHAGYGVTREMYDWVGDTLIAALAKANGEQWTPAHAAGWQEAYRAIVALMLAGYPDARQASLAGGDGRVRGGRVRRLLRSMFGRSTKATEA